jgi:chromosome segregation ATPase
LRNYFLLLIEAINKMATSTFTTLTKNLTLYTPDEAQYLQIAQDGTTATQLNFKVKNSTGDTDNDTILPYFRNLTIRSSAGATINLATKCASYDTSIASNTTNIATNTASCAANAANIATNSTAITTEAGARAAGDASLQAQIDAANTAVGGSIATVSADLLTEINTRIAEGATLQTNIDAEAAARAAAITAEASVRDTADTAIIASVATNTSAISALETNLAILTNAAPESLNTFAEVAAQFDNLGLAAILTRLDNLEAAVSALQGN